MENLKFLFLSVLQTLLRVLPFPAKTGLIRIGNPGRNAPVFLTCNFRLTVDRVTRAIEGIDAFLLVANSRGVNVWCAAAGGHLTNHSVISVLKTSGIDKMVDHRQVILPQLAATAIEGKTIHRQTGWKVIWGPVYADSIPDFLKSGLQKTAQMRTVSFRLLQRFEMAVAWAFPISLLTLLVLPFWRQGALWLAGFVWGWSLLLFLSFPLYRSRLRDKAKNIGFIFFDFGERGFSLLFWVIFMGCVAGYALLAGDLSPALVLRWGISSLIVVLIFGLDLKGSTPVYGSSLLEGRLLHVVLDAERCKGAGFCEQVCPKNVFDVDHEGRLASPARASECLRCGACIVQCPLDALSFSSPAGDPIAPDTVRKFKLSMLGSRKVKDTIAGQGSR